MSWSRWASSSIEHSRWSDREPGLGDVAASALELIRAGRARLRTTLLASLVFALATVAVVVLLRPSYSPRFVLRVVEPNADPTTLPRARRQLAEYVREGVLTNEALLGVMERHGILAAMRRNNPPGAVESFREDIDVGVYQNYFLEERTAAEAPRSARLVVSYHSKDPELALAVTRELGQLVVERERRAREQLAVRALRAAEVELERANRSLVQHRAEIIRKRTKILYGAAPDPLDEVQFVSMLGSLEWREREVERRQARRAALELGSTLESRSLGLSFQVADAGAVRRSSELGLRQLGLVGVLALVGGLPLAAAFVGAFDPKRGAT